MRSSSEILRGAIDAATKTLQSLTHSEGGILSAADLVASCLTNGHKVLVCGNGGSAADAADFCTEFACRFAEDRRPYAAINLAAGGSLLTATANDYGFDETFARQVAAFGTAGDLLIGLTTSGNSKNIQRAIEEAKKRRLHTIALLGRDGGSVIGKADIDILVKGDLTARIQEGHKFVLHVICEICESRLPRA
jgi:D-sedoheptulose 7-phosphate isomerase